jgi:hypothetical protein
MASHLNRQEKKLSLADSKNKKLTKLHILSMRKVIPGIEAFYLYFKGSKVLCAQVVL